MKLTVKEKRSSKRKEGPAVGLHLGVGLAARVTEKMAQHKQQQASLGTRCMRVKTRKHILAHTGRTVRGL